MLEVLRGLNGGFGEPCVRVSCGARRKGSGLCFSFRMPWALMLDILHTCLITRTALEGGWKVPFLSRGSG